jgi:hypothetical protein
MKMLFYFIGLLFVLEAASRIIGRDFVLVCVALVWAGKHLGR